ncbi:subtilase family protein [mine drainage metagenome]|uniref:Subtilase family protein n=1 Tax=mine drainage metagenome TaxID=410659 RepID=A0A1J5SH13_9ZZZZ
MKNNPIQIVINSSDYVTPQEVNAGGSNHDFYEGEDDAFWAHKQKLVKQLSSIKTSLARSGYSSGAYVRVTLREDALAKSHRPTSALFKHQTITMVGAGALGELYFEVTPSQIDWLATRVEEAEPTTNLKEVVNKKSGEVKLVANPSRLRSEVGAVDELVLPTSSEKRSFDVNSAIEWLSQPVTGGAYFVELFAFPVGRDEMASASSVQQALITSFSEGLRTLDDSIEVGFVSRSGRYNSRMMSIRICNGGVFSWPKGRQNSSTSGERNNQRGKFSPEKNRHQSLLAFLDQHPLVRRIHLPPVIEKSADPISAAIGNIGIPPSKTPGSTYPMIGVIDGGVSDFLNTWKIGSWDNLATVHKSLSHGTFIAGLMCGGRSFGNSSDVARELDGCGIFDISIFPDDVSGVFESYYPNGAPDFFDEIENAVSKAVGDHGIRVFNLSINLMTPVAEDDYSPWAERLDEIARLHQVIFVVSAGNLRGKHRPTMPNNPAGILSTIASFPYDDTILQPAESVSALSVGALNVPNVIPHVSETPTNYTRRGPGLRVGVKPDLAHFGGSVPTTQTQHHGLISIDPSGQQVTGMGTSYAAPLVAKSLAALASSIQGSVSKETLTALLIHHAAIPKPLSHNSLSSVARQFVGFGVPSSSDDMLLTEDNAISLVFNGVLTHRKELNFEFTWPQCLVEQSTGKCRGYAWMTLVYSPPLNRAYGAEFVRVNLDAHLQQLQTKGGWKGQLQQAYMPKNTNTPAFEQELIAQGLKWWPVKQYRKKSARGVGKSSNWRVQINALSRDGEKIPKEGVPFSVVLTISDPVQNEAVFGQFRQWLLANSVNCADIRTAARILPRS